MKLLVSNVGSTSLKFKLFDMPEERVLCEAKIERVGSRDAAIMSYRSHLSGARFGAEGLCIPSYAEGIALFLEKLTGDETGVIKGVEEISAIGFKTVLSRGYYGVHELTDEVMENMREYLYIAPVHNAAYIEAIGQFKAAPNKYIKSIACIWFIFAPFISSSETAICSILLFDKSIPFKLVLKNCVPIRSASLKFIFFTLFPCKLPLLIDVLLKIIPLKLLSDILA